MGNFLDFFKKIFVNPNKEQTQEYYQDAISANSGSDFTASEKNIIKIPEFMAVADMVANDISSLGFFDTKIEYKDNVKANKIKKESNWNLLLNKTPNSYQSSVEFWKTNIFNLLIRGGFFFYIYRDNQNRPKELIPIHPNSIKKVKDKDGKYGYEITIFNSTYEYSREKTKTLVPYEDVFSMYWFDLENISDLSFRTAYSSLLEQLGLINNYDLSQLNQSARILAHVKIPDRIDQERKDNLKNSFKDFFTNAKKIDTSAVLVTDVDTEVNILNSDKTQIKSPLSQEFRQDIIIKLANALHIPLPKLNVVVTGQSFYKSREGVNRDYLSDCINPIANKIIAKLNVLIFPKLKNQEFIFKNTKLLDMDDSTRGEYIAKMRQNGVLTTNELRELGGYLPVEDGDKLFGNGNLIELGKVVKPQDNNDKDNDNEEKEEKEVT